MLKYHAEGFKKAGGQIVAVADLAPGAAAKAAEDWDIPLSFEEMLEKAVLDAVSIIVLNKFHAPLALQCLHAGKHVFCEKPPALTADQVEEMLSVSQAVGKQLMFNFNNRARPESREMMKLIGAGDAGTINSAQAKWIRRTGIPGFGAVMGQTFDTFITDPGHKGPWGIPDNAEGATDVEAAAHGFVSFKTGQVLSLQVSWAEMVKREEVSVVFQGTKAGGKVERLFGTDGLDETAIDTCELYTQEDGKSVNTIIEVEECEDMGRIDSAANFVEAIDGKAEPLNTPHQALALMQVIDAIYKSSESGKPVVL